jgi:hypothetical protein
MMEQNMPNEWAAETEVGRWIYERIASLMDAKPGTNESAELSYLATIVSQIEEYGEEACRNVSLAPYGA